MVYTDTYTHVRAESCQINCLSAASINDDCVYKMNHCID